MMLGGGCKKQPLFFELCTQFGTLNDLKLYTKVNIIFCV